MKEWQEVILGELFEVKHGWAFIGEHFSNSGQLIVVTPGNFIERGGFKIQHGKEKFYLGKFPQEYLLKKDDIVIAMTEQGPGLLGSPGLIPGDGRFLHNQRIGLITNIKSEKIFKKYIYYLFFTNNIRQEIFGSSTGTKVKHTAPKRIYRIKVFLPPLKVQKRIASILSAYDELIENNLKRIKLLEVLAQRTYEEWFVKFRVNGEDLVIDGKTGLPVGWKIVPLGNFIKFQKGKKANLVSDEYQDGFEKLLLLDGIESGKYPYTQPTNQVVADRGDLIMLMDGARSSKVFFADRGVVGSTIAKIEIVGKTIPSSLLKHYFEANFEWMQINNTGAAIPHANKNFISGMPFRFPTNKVLQNWKLLIDPLYSQIQCLKDQILLLKESRNILLPRLMNGTISVGEAGESFAMAAEPVAEYNKA